MKKRGLSLLLALALCLGLLGAALPQASAAAAPTERQAYEAMTALKSKYPEGMRWTDENYCSWHGGIFSGGSGCAGFAFMLSDAAFGTLPARKLTKFEYSDVRVGDILRINHDTHFVIVLEVNDSGVVIAEGNYNNSVHWGRTLSKAEVLAADYMMTRYPLAQAAAPTAYARTQTVLLDGKPVTFRTYALKDSGGNLTNYIKLRDLAYYLNGTKAQFSVDWSASRGITLGTGRPYTPNGSELSTPFSGDRAYKDMTAATRVDAGSYNIRAIVLTDDRGGDYTYYGLRDMGRYLGFNVSYINWQIVINTNEPYSDAQ